MDAVAEADIERRIDDLLAQARATVPGFALAYKDEDRLQQLIGRLCRPFNRRYLSHYTTVLYPRIYFPTRQFWSDMPPWERYRLLRHELQHIADRHRFGLLFDLSYLFLFPAGLTLRAVWEMRAYRHDLEVELERDGSISEATIERIVERFAGPEYLFMLAHRGLVRRWLSAHIRAAAEAASASSAFEGIG